MISCNKWEPFTSNGGVLFFSVLIDIFYINPRICNVITNGFNVVGRIINFKSPSQSRYVATLKSAIY